MDLIAVKNEEPRMGAFDTFTSYINALSPSERNQLNQYIDRQREELLAARSEDARLRILESFMEEMRHLKERNRDHRS